MTLTETEKIADSLCLLAETLSLKTSCANLALGCAWKIVLPYVWHCGKLVPESASPWEHWEGEPSETLQTPGATDFLML
jgi:hypothetical protein